MWCFSVSGLNALLFWYITLVHASSKVKFDTNCRNIKDSRSLKGFYGDIPDRAISGDHLNICSRGPTCCRQEMEVKLTALSRTEFQEQLSDTISQLRLIFAAQAQKFDEYFKDLLKKSKTDFHEMFLRTYGMLYDTNSYIFEDLFDNLERYYLKGGVNLNDALEDFFDKLYRKMFQVLNGQYSFSETYMSCVSQQMEELKPFGDVPKKLTVEIKRSFVATRTFVQALIIGRDVVKHLQEITPSTDCVKGLMRLNNCPLCKGIIEIKPCANFCFNVMRGCLAYLTDVHYEWNNYINAMLMLASRLESSFNIESVVDPIDLKISDAIMNFQENGHVVSQELFKQCGQPKLGKRNARHELNYETLKFGHQQNSVRPTTAAGTSIDRLVQSITKKIRKTKSFWSQLSKSFCNGGTKNLPSEECWNGGDVGKYESLVVGEGLANQSKNPEVFVNSSLPEWIVNQQVLTLQLITTKLTHAYNGLDVLWQDSSDSDWESSGSGSGNGDDEDDEGSPPTSSFGDIYFSISTPKLPIHNVENDAIHPSTVMPESSAAAAKWRCSTVTITTIVSLLSVLIYSSNSYG